jgi:hypothetical protein
VQALRAYVRNEDPERLRRQLGAGAAELAQIVPEIREVVGGVPAPTAGDPDDARFRLFDATSSFLRAAGTAQPLLIVLDDLGAADTPSLLLLQFVTGDLAESRLMIVGSHRDLEPGSAGPLAATIAELDRQGVTHRLHVGGLAEAARGNTGVTSVAATRSAQPPRLRRQGSMTTQPRRCSSAASCSAGTRRSACSAADNRSADAPARPRSPVDPASCSRATNVAASSRVNLPAAWRCVRPMGPRASRNPSWPAAWSRASSSCTCLADAGGPDC